MRRIGRLADAGWLPRVALLGFALATLAAPARADDSWDAIYIGGSKVGHIHTRVAPIKDRGRDLIRVQLDYVVNFKRSADSVTMSMRYGTIETPEGSVLRLDTRTLSGQEELRTYGDVIAGKMGLTLEIGGQKRTVSIPWGAEVRGPYSAEMSLARKPMAPGETRELKEFIPDLNAVGQRTMVAKAEEEVELGGGVKRSLLRIETTYTLEGKARPELAATHWVDTGGQVLKSFTDILGGCTTYRTTREAANKPDGGAQLDLIAASILKVARPIRDAGNQKRIVYKLTMTEDDPATLFPADRRQTIKPSGDGKTATLEVQTAGPDAGTPGPEAVADEFLKPNPMIDSADATVIRLARQAVGDKTDPWAKAVAVQQWVSKNVAEKNFKTAFAPAHEVARNLSGDCTEHGVLTAAMCRAVGVPARVVVGLVYADTLKGFGFHMWNEVYVNRRWVAIDAAFNQSDVDATHLKLAEASLDGVSPYEPFLAVVRVFSKTKLEPVEVR